MQADCEVTGIAPTFIPIMRLLLVFHVIQVAPAHKTAISLITVYKKSKSESADLTVATTRKLQMPLGTTAVCRHIYTVSFSNNNMNNVCQVSLATVKILMLQRRQTLCCCSRNGSSISIPPSSGCCSSRKTMMQ